MVHKGTCTEVCVSPDWTLQCEIHHCNAQREQFCQKYILYATSALEFDILTQLAFIIMCQQEETSGVTNC